MPEYVSPRAAGSCSKVRAPSAAKVLRAPLVPSRGRRYSMGMRLFTIGFTRSSAEDFFGRLLKAKVKRVIDVRLHNSSHLAGFAKKEDLRYFLQAIGGIDYLHEPRLAPDEATFAAFKKEHGGAAEFEKRVRALLVRRRAETLLPKATFDQACLLCAEPSPEHCHRRVVAEYLQKKWKDLDVPHL
jgi:uncharacterized protein (DUF488 family)